MSLGFALGIADILGLCLMPIFQHLALIDSIMAFGAVEFPLSKSIGWIFLCCVELSGR